MVGVGDMKASALILLLAVSSSLAQGTFQNLDFESATIVPIPGDYLQRVEFTSAFPGRTIAGGLSGVLYNRIYLDSTGISIIDDPSCANFGCRILDGNYTAVLNAGIVGTITNVQDIKLSQTGMVPATAQSLRFSAFFDGIIEPP